MKLEAHPAAKLFPLMSDEEFAGLRLDIHAHGLREAIVVYKGQVLDGRNRLRACQELKIEPEVREWQNGKEGDSPTAFVLSANLHRRHLSASQKAIIAVEAKPMFDAEAKARQREAGKQFGKGKKNSLAQKKAKPSEGKSAAAAGNALNVSRSTVEKAQKVATAAPELTERIKAGTLSLTDADAISRLTQPEQRDAAIAIMENNYAKSGKEAVHIVKTHNPDPVELAKAARATPIKEDHRAENWMRAVGKVGDLVAGIEKNGGAGAIANVIGPDLRGHFRNRLSDLGTTITKWGKDLEDAQNS
jgi:hypothetical protein